MRFALSIACAGVASVSLLTNAAAQEIPVISSVAVTGTAGPNFGLIIEGSGFGAGEKHVIYPYTGDSAYFKFIDMHPRAARAHARGVGYIEWSAGYAGKKVTDPVTLNYISWSDTQIVFSGLAGEYGQNGFILTSGDKFEVIVSAPTGTAKARYVGTVP